MDVSRLMVRLVTETSQMIFGYHDGFRQSLLEVRLVRIASSSSIHMDIDISCIYNKKS